MTDNLSHVFFALYGVLIDPMLVRAQYLSAVARVMNEHYGESAALWESAFRRVLQDWNSYYADLDLADEDGVDDMWEGMFRTTRAIFRLADIPEPPKPELTAFSRQLPELAAAGCSALYPDVLPLVKMFKQGGLSLAAFAPMSVGQIRGFLRGGDIEDCFDLIIGLDTAERFHHDADYWKLVVIKTKATTECCLVVACDDDTLDAARSIGMKTKLISFDDVTDRHSALRQLTLEVLAGLNLPAPSC